MKRIIKGIFLFVLIFAFPLATYALSNQTFYVSIDKYVSLDVGGLSFSNISFKDYSSSSVPVFGLTSTVNNNSSNNISYNATIYYYDSNYNLVAQTSSTEIALPGSNYFTKMSNLDILGMHNINEIYYYCLVISSNDDPIAISNNTPSKFSQYKSKDYVIDKYDINIVVNENNTFDITEKITVYFNVSKHGIYRTIPLKNKITRLDGITSTNRAQISNIEVDNEYKILRENGNYKIQIGSANRTLTGEQTYVIKYNYNIGKDPIKGYDELYYNIIGTEWDTVIGNISFTITMPKEFDPSKLGFSSGIKKSTDNSKIIYDVVGNTITGSYNGILEAGDALTVRCELPEGYFVDAGLTINAMNYLMFSVPIIFLALSILLWYKFGRDQVVETVEFYPPEGLNSLEVGFLYKGKAENKDVTSLLIYLANKGYIKIINKKIDVDTDKINLSESAKNKANQKIVELQNKINEEKQNNPKSSKIKYYENLLNVYENIDTPIDYKQYGLNSLIRESNSEQEFIIKKLKDYDGNNLNERLFMEGLFEYNRTEVTVKMLYDNFYRTNNRILHNMNNKKNVDKIIEKTSVIKKAFIILMFIVTYCLITLIPTFTYADPLTAIFALFFPTIGFYVFFYMLFAKINIIIKIIISLFSLKWGLSLWNISVLPVLLQDHTYLIGYIIGLGCLLGMGICLKYLPKRTPYGCEMLGKLKGFKTFLETAEKDKLEGMVMQNPTYFFDILPYTYVLDVSDVWIKKFETISLQDPTWYDSSSAFDSISFETFMDSTLSSSKRVMSSIGSSDGSSSDSGGGSSGGGSSGGGLSGGGSGGGGGGTW